MNKFSAFVNICRKQLFHNSCILGNRNSNHFFKIGTNPTLRPSRFFSVDHDHDEEEEEKHGDDELLNIIKRPMPDEFKPIYQHPQQGHNLLLIQPRIKFGNKRDTVEAAELKMDEAVALVETLPGWRVLDKFVVTATSLNTPLLFGKGNLQKLKDIKSKNPYITGIFFGVDILTALQDAKLQEYFNLQIFDRYQIVLQIFHDHAHTKEAKLQVAMAEIPYYRVKLAVFAHNYKHDIMPQIVKAGSDGETIMERRRRVLFERELKIKKALNRLKSQRQKLRQSEKRSSLPIVAVVGYTNCGKTTLIKSLTSDSSLVPEDKMFATLDVTLHSGLLPSSQKVLYVDTVGFISDVPTELIASFKSTLEDIAMADVIIHIRDISHPDTEMQKQVVMDTLSSLDLPSRLLNSIIEVGNKVDKLSDNAEVIDKDLVLISATLGTNLKELAEKVEDSILANTSRSIHYFRIPNGGNEYSWLFREAAIKSAVADEGDPNFLIVETIISSAKLAKFKHYFGDLTISCT